MTDSHADAKPHTGAADPSADRPGDHPAPRLRASVVRYEGRPNRCTVYPNEATGVERMSTWLSADADAFVALDDAR